MNEQEQKVIEHLINRLDIAITTLTGQQTQIGYQIEELEKIKAGLTRLLPDEKRIERLFGHD